MKVSQSFVEKAQLVVLSIGVIGVIYYSGTFALESLKLFFELPVEIATALLTAGATIIVSVLSITIGKYLERKKEIEFELREKKIPVYQGFMNFSSRLFIGKKAGNKEVSEKEMIKFFNDFTYELIIWGSDDVIKAWSEFRRKAIENKKDSSLDMMLSFEKLMLVIRKDIGHKNRGIKEEAILRMFISDYDDYKKNKDSF